MRRGRFFSLLAGTLLVLTLTPTPFAEDGLLTFDPDTVNWEAASPTMIHQKMWHDKVLRLRAAALAEERRERVSQATAQTDYDVTCYRVDLRVNDTTEIIYGSVTVEAVAVAGTVTSIELDLLANMVVDSVTSSGGGALSYTRPGDLVVVDFASAYSSGQPFAATIHYHGHPTEGGFQGFSFDTRGGTDVISTLSEPYFARSWWPCKDRMDDKPDSMHMAITVDTGFYCASNGILDSTVNTGNVSTYYYRVTYPMTTYLFSLAISDYTVWTQEYVYNSGADTMPIVHAVYPDRYTYSLPRWGIIPEAIDLLAEDWGPYPFLREKYGHANFEWGGGMEHQTMTSMSGSSFGFLESVVVHELGHQWFGDMITCNNWGHIWLNEGFATYSEALYLLNRDGWTAYRNYMLGMRYTGGGTIYVADTSQVWNIFSSRVYDKGAWVVHMLRGVLGEDGFTAAINAYVNSPHRHGSATTEEFQFIVEQATGQDLDWFFQEWIYGEYYPRYSYSFWSEPKWGGGRKVFLRIDQTQTSNPQIFSMPFDVFLNYASGPDTTIRIQPNARTNVYELNGPADLSAVTIDPQSWVLMSTSSSPWTMQIVTPVDSIAPAAQYYAYTDTLGVRGGSGVKQFSITGGALPTGITLSSGGVLSGVTTQTGDFAFTVTAADMTDGYTDTEPFTLTVSPSTVIPGDLDLNGSVGLPDLSLLINYLFINPGQAFPAPNAAADVTGDCTVGLPDLSLLIDHLFVTFGPLNVGCAP